MALENSVVVLVLQTLKKLTNTGQCFTAFDVTKAVRSQTEEFVGHNDVRDLVHQFFEQGFFNGFSRQSHTFTHQGQVITAQLFIPPNGSPSTYDPDKIILDKPQDDEDDDFVIAADSEVHNMSDSGETTPDPNDTQMDDSSDAEDCCGGSCHTCDDDELMTEPNPPQASPPVDDCCGGSCDTPPTKSSGFLNSLLKRFGL